MCVRRSRASRGARRRGTPGRTPGAHPGRLPEPHHLGRLGVVDAADMGVATRRVKTVLNNRTIPLLAIFSALTFTIMMFNVPVPGGTTAHGVGGDADRDRARAVGGGHRASASRSSSRRCSSVTAASWRSSSNCFNMAHRPAVRRLRRLPAARPAASAAVEPPGLGRRHRRLRRDHRGGAAASASSSASSRSCSPRTGTPCTARTASARRSRRCSLAHLFGASIVEGADHRPGRRLPPEAPPGVPDLGCPRCSRRATRPRARPAAGPSGSSSAARSWARSALLAVVGLVIGGGDPAHAFGADWARSTGPRSASMLLVVGAHLRDPRAARLAPAAARG